MSIRSKYHAHKVNCDGEIFDSVREYSRWQELQLMERSGAISDLQRQVKYELIPPQREPDIIGPHGGVRKGKLIERPITYVADFVYTDKDGKTVIEDTKGFRTKEYIIKRKLMLYVYGVRITET